MEAVLGGNKGDWPLAVGWRSHQHFLGCLECTFCVEGMEIHLHLRKGTRATSASPCPHPISPQPQLAQS